MPCIAFTGMVTIPPRTEKFIPKDAFVANTAKGKHVKISYVHPAFIEKFGDKAEGPSAIETVLLHYNLTHLSVFAPVIKEISIVAATKTTPGELYSMMEKQPDGPESEAGPLLANGNANLFEMETVSGDASLVSIGWHDHGWYVCSHSITDPLEWRAGSRIFSLDAR